MREVLVSFGIVCSPVKGTGYLGERLLMLKDSLNPWNGARWIAVDSAGTIHARIYRCSRERALVIARLLFPEEENLRICGLNFADRRRCEAAEAAPLLTPDSCKRVDIAIPSESKPPIDFLAGRLKQRFPRLRARTVGPSDGL